MVSSHGTAEPEDDDALPQTHVSDEGDADDSEFSFEVSPRYSQPEIPHARTILLKRCRSPTHGDAEAEESKLRESSEGYADGDSGKGVKPIPNVASQTRYVSESVSVHGNDCSRLRWREAMIECLCYCSSPQLE